MYSYKLFPEQKLIVVVFRGLVSLPEILEYFMSIAYAPGFDKDFCGVADLRKAQLDLKPQDLSAFDPSNEKDLTEGPWVFLVNDPKTTALSFLIKDQADDNHPLQVFSEPKTASGYLGLDVAPFIQDVAAEMK